MMQPEWRRIAGIHVQNDAEMGVVWLAHDKTTDTIHLYDACLFKREVMAVIAEGLNARGRWVPIAWESSAKDFAEKLLERGCNTLHDPVSETEAMAEVLTRDISERMRTGRFKVDKRLAEWLTEFKSHRRDDSKVPRTSSPLMSATRYAVAALEYARRQGPKSKTGNNFPRLSIL